MSVIVVQIALIFLPGIIWASFDARWASKKPVSQFQLTINAFLFGLATYAIVFLLYGLFGKKFDLVGDIVRDGAKSISLSNAWDEILFAVIIAFISSIIWIYFSTYKIFTRFLQTIKATNKFGDEDVWDYVLNSSDPSVEYVNVRDFEKEIVYSGYVSVFSETDKLRELILRDVEVTNFAGEILFNMPKIYIARAPDDIHIEFPYDPQTADTTDDQEPR